LDWAEGEGGQVRVRQSRTLEEMGDGIEGAKHTYLDEVVAEGEEGVEGADAEVRDVELRGGSGRSGQVRSGELCIVWMIGLDSGEGSEGGRESDRITYPVQRGVEGVAGDGVLQARPQRGRGGAGRLHGERDDPVAGCHRRRAPGLV